ncbi:sulfurtransferase TusA family protein [Virgibacillus alimentarius]|uniref:TusA-related sulfurtransferase n=1 Tax=Virgibacillus alimentarius TaxID=698769 RepID=A0ABS4SEB3_9BACI|nr:MULTISPECIES: sulfurtransferase TusA family protein [Virgibacillus]MBP2258712.1 TusA-related sulfurtransferase [Virgibacillus alimentarius]HLR66734.1 sulfurtransferase TusA family protein [Virgibacillus sp.]
MEIAKVLDATGLACPMPIVRAKKTMETIGTGEILEIHTTDEGSKSDLTAWAKSGGHELLEQTKEDQVFKFWIKKA